MSQRTAVQFDPTVSSGSYTLAAPLTAEEIAAARAGQSEYCKPVYKWVIRDQEFMAKTLRLPKARGWKLWQNQEDELAAAQKREYELSVALVEPPGWKKLSELELSKLKGDGSHFSQEECAEAEEWLCLRRKHPGFAAINRCRQYLADEKVILMDPCVCTLYDRMCDKEFLFLSRYPQQVRPKDQIGWPMLPDECNELMPNSATALVPAVSQVLQGLHYLSHVARVQHGDIHTQYHAETFWPMVYYRLWRITRHW